MPHDVSLDTDVRFHLISGINVWNDEGSIYTWKPLIEDMGYEVISHHKFIILGTAWHLNPLFAQEIANTVLANDILIGHSNAALVIREVARIRRFKAAILLHGAIDRKKRIPNCDFVHNWCWRRDWILKMGSWLPWHDWGTAGRDGFRNGDPRHINIRVGSYRPKIRGHSDMFKDTHAPVWCERVVKKGIGRAS